MLEGLDGELAGGDVVARLEWLTAAFADAFDLAGWAISRGGGPGRRCGRVVAAERRDRADRNAPAIRITLDDELYAPADYTARALAQGRRLLHRGGRRRGRSERSPPPAQAGLHRRDGRRGARGRRLGVARGAVLRPAHPRRHGRADQPAAAGERGRPRRRAGLRRRGDLAREDLEHLDVAAHVGLRVEDGERPLLVRARRHEHAAVHVVEPGELRQLVVDARQVVAVLADRLPAHRHAALGAHADGVRRQAVGGDDLLAARHQRVVERVQVGVGGRREDLEERRLGGGHDERVAVERPLLADAAVGHERAELGGHADGAAGQAAADRLGEAHDVGRDAEQLRGAAGRHRRARLDLVEDQHDVVLAGELPHALQVARERRHDVDVHHGRLHDHPGHAALQLGEGALERAGVVEGDGARLLRGGRRIAQAVGDGVGAVAVAHQLGGRLDGDHHGVVVAVVGALDLDQDVAPRVAAGEVDGVHRGLRARVREAPEREPPAPPELLRHDDRALRGRGEVRARVHARLHGGRHHRVGVADAHDAEAVVEVDVLVAVDVPDAGAEAAVDVDGPRVGLLELGGDAAGHDGAGAGELLAGAAGALGEAGLLAPAQRCDPVGIDVGARRDRRAHPRDAIGRSGAARCGYPASGADVWTSGEVPLAVRSQRAPPRRPTPARGTRAPRRCPRRAAGRGGACPPRAP